jgi:hypothetical protein
MRQEISKLPPGNWARENTSDYQMIKANPLKLFSVAGDNRFIRLISC